MNHNVIYEKLGCKLLQPNFFFDKRGFFCEVFNEDLAKFLNFKFIQENISMSSKNVMRGLHLQYKPHTSKLVRVLSGKILDVAVDCRPFSSTFGQHVMLELDSKDLKMFYIPAGFAHGFLSIEDNTIVNYLVDQPYNSKGEIAINPFSKDLLIDWPISKDEVLMSEKDKIAKKFGEILWNQFWSPDV